MMSLVLLSAASVFVLVTVVLPDLRDDSYALVPSEVM